MLLQRGKIHFLIHLFRALPLLISIIHITLQHALLLHASCVQLIRTATIVRLLNALYKLEIRLLENTQNNKLTN